MPTHAELNPNTRLVNNRFAAQVAENEALQKYVAEQGLSWVNDEEFIKNVLDLILASDLYNEYLDNENDSYETDKEFWRAVFKKLICGNEMIEEYLEDKSIYWNDDIEIVETFTLKQSNSSKKKQRKTETASYVQGFGRPVFRYQTVPSVIIERCRISGAYQQTYEELGNRTYRQYGPDHHAGCTG